MLVKVVESNTEYQSDDFRVWIRKHEDNKFFVVKEAIGNDGLPVYMLAKVNFWVSKRFCEEVK